MISPLPRSTKLWYGLGQMAEGLKNEAFSVFLLFYYTQVVGLSGTLSGQAILIALLFDAVADPLSGVLSDRLHSRWGRRHPFLYASPLSLAAFFYLSFSTAAAVRGSGTPSYGRGSMRGRREANDPKRCYMARRESRQLTASTRLLHSSSTRVDSRKRLIRLNQQQAMISSVEPRSP